MIHRTGKLLSFSFIFVLSFFVLQFVPFDMFSLPLLHSHRRRTFLFFIFLPLSVIFVLPPEFDKKTKQMKVDFLFFRFNFLFFFLFSFNNFIFEFRSRHLPSTQKEENTRIYLKQKKNSIPPESGIVQLTHPKKKKKEIPSTPVTGEENIPKKTKKLIFTTKVDLGIYKKLKADEQFRRTATAVTMIEFN